jgi:hypothetical protein
MRTKLEHLLPPVPGRIGTAQDWAERLDHGWYLVSEWGRDGWPLGDPQRALVAHFDHPGGDALRAQCQQLGLHHLRAVHGQARYIDGDVYVRAYLSRQDRDEATDWAALFHWHETAQGPADLPSDAYAVHLLRPHHRGAYGRHRHLEEGGGRYRLGFGFGRGDGHGATVCVWAEDDDEARAYIRTLLGSAPGYSTIDSPDFRRGALPGIPLALADPRTGRSAIPDTARVVPPGD